MLCGCGEITLGVLCETLAHPFSWPRPRDPTIIIVGSVWSTMSAGRVRIWDGKMAMTYQGACV